MGGQIICGPARLRHRETKTIWNSRRISFFLDITTYFGSFTFLAILYDQVGSPPAHRQQTYDSILGITLNGAGRPLFIAFSS